MLAAEDPLHAESPRNRYLNFFTTIFTVEIIIKAISYGLLFHDGAFMRSGFNLLDILVFSPFISSLMPSLLSTFFVFSVYSDRYLPSTRHKVRDGTTTMTAVMIKRL